MGSAHCKEKWSLCSCRRVNVFGTGVPEKGEKVKKRKYQRFEMTG
jgi:hypothetical protein